MADTLMDSQINTAWPPRGGWTFFFLWIGGTLVASFVGQAVWSTIVMTHAPSALHEQRWIFVIPAIALGAWEGWMLFVRESKRRWMLWATVPAVSAVLSYLLGDSTKAPMSNVIVLLSIIAAISNSLLLTGLRRRPALYLLVQIASVILTLLGNFLFAISGGYGGVEKFAGKLNDFFGLSSSVAFSGAYLVTAVFSGLWLARALLTATALAWWMPPVRSVLPNGDDTAVNISGLR